MDFKKIIDKIRGKEATLSPFSLSEKTQEELLTPINEEGVTIMNEEKATNKIITTGQITLVDLTDIISQATAPTPAKEGMLWMNISKNPPILMVYKNGAWVEQNDFKADPQYKVITTQLQTNTSDIEINKQSIALKVSQEEVETIVVEEIGKVQITARNLLLKSGDAQVIISQGDANRTGATYRFSIPYLTEIRGKKLVFTYDWEYIGETPSGSYYVQTGGPQYSGLSTRTTISESNRSGSNVSLIWYPVSSVDTDNIYFRTDDMNGTLRISNPRLYFGDRDVGWNPAPEDSQNKFTSIDKQYADLETALDGISLEVGSITTASYATCINTALEFYVGSGIDIASSVREKVETSNIPLYIEGSVDGSTYLNISSIESTDAKGAIIDVLNFGKNGLTLRRAKDNASVFDELTPKGVYRRVEASTGDALITSDCYYDNTYENLIKVMAGGKLKIYANKTSVKTKHIVPLSVMANIESAVASVEITKNQINQKVNVNDVIAAINLGIEDDESNILIMADRIKLKGAITVEALDKGLQEGYIEDNGKTMINGGFISAKSLKLSESMQANGVVIKDKKGLTTFSVEGDTGLVNIRGNVQSIDYADPVFDENGNMTKVGIGWLISADGKAIFNQGEFRSKIILPRAGMSNEGNVRIWAGGNIPSVAPFRVMDNGDIFVEKGNFKGVFSGEIKIGGITISDNEVAGVTGRSRAVIEIRDDGDRVVTTLADDSSYIGTDVQIKDTLAIDSSAFRLKKGKIIVGNSNVEIEANSPTISFKEGATTFSFNDNRMEFTSKQTSGATDFVFKNSARDAVVEIEGQLKVKSNVDIGVVTIRKHNDGIDFLFI